MLEKENSLPSPEDHSPLGNRHKFARAGQSHTDVGRHVIRPLKRVAVAASILGDHALEETFQVPRSRGVCIFKNHKASAGVTDKNGNHSLANGCALQDSLHLGGDFIKSLAARWNIKKTSLRIHTAENSNQNITEKSQKKYCCGVNVGISSQPSPRG